MAARCQRGPCGGTPPGGHNGVVRNGGVSFWWQQVGLPSPTDRLDGDVTCDVAIVGAGLTGLWTAHYLHEADPTLDIRVVEAEFAGFGASGRNGGWLSSELPGSADGVRRRGGRGRRRSGCVPPSAPRVRRGDRRRRTRGHRGRHRAQRRAPRRPVAGPGRAPRRRAVGGPGRRADPRRRRRRPGTSTPTARASTRRSWWAASPASCGSAAYASTRAPAPSRSSRAPWSPIAARSAHRSCCAASRGSPPGSPATAASGSR